jgi:hypothetical protein
LCLTSALVSNGHKLGYVVTLSVIFSLIMNNFEEKNLDLEWT